MTGLLSALRGLTHRAGISVSILLVAVVAVAAVTVGPTYYTAARSSILPDSVNQAPVTGRGLEVSQCGPLLAHYLGGSRVPARVFTAPVGAAETTVQAAGQTVPLVYRSGVCRHLQFAAGRRPSAPGQVAVSSSLALLLHWQQRVSVAWALATRPRLLIADEPTAEQDAASRELVLARMLGISDAGGSLVLATHDPDVARRCDRVLDLGQRGPGPGGPPRDGRPRARPARAPVTHPGIPSRTARHVGSRATPARDAGPGPGRPARSAPATAGGATWYGDGASRSLAWAWCSARWPRPARRPPPGTPPATTSSGRRCTWSGRPGTAPGR